MAGRSNVASTIVMLGSIYVIILAILCVLGTTRSKAGCLSLVISGTDDKPNADNLSDLKVDRTQNLNRVSFDLAFNLASPKRINANFPHCWQPGAAEIPCAWQQQHVHHNYDESKGRQSCCFDQVYRSLKESSTRILLGSKLRPWHGSFTPPATLHVAFCPGTAAALTLQFFFDDFQTFDLLVL